MNVHDITGNADLFRAAYPNWPHAERENTVQNINEEIMTGCGSKMTDGHCYGFVNGHWHFQNGDCDTEPAR